MYAARFPATQYDEYELWTSFVFASVLICGIVPVLVFKYVNFSDFWALAVLVEILGHLWGFKIKDLIVYYAYHHHFLFQLYEEQTVDYVDPTVSYCDLVNPDYLILDATGTVNASELGWVGYNLDWMNYSMNTSVFEGYYEVDSPCVEDDHHPAPSGLYNSSNTTETPETNATTGSSRRHLSGPAHGTGCSDGHHPAPAPHHRARQLSSGQSHDDVPSPSPYNGVKYDLNASDSIEVGPGRTCNFQARTTRELKGYPVEKFGKLAYVFTRQSHCVWGWYAKGCMCLGLLT